MISNCSRPRGNKTALASALVLVLGAQAAQAITPLPANTRFQMSITGGCFDFGDCVTSGLGVLQDNTTANQASITIGTQLGNLAPGTYGSGIVGDGLMGVIDFVTDGSGNLTVVSFSQDSYLNTAGGTFWVDGNGATVSDDMSGTVDGSGNMTFTPNNRQGLAASFADTLANQPWNLDNTSDGFGSGLYRGFTTGTSTNRQQGLSAPFTLTGSQLSDAGAGMWTGTLVSAGNIGQGWGSFDNQQYAEVWDISIQQLNNPVAVDDTSTTDQNVAITIDVLANDNDPNTDIDSTTLTVVDASGLSGTGTAVVNAGQIDYTPDPAFLGTESFTYRVSDAAANQSNIATVSITVSASGNTAPVANDDSDTTAEDTPVTIDLLANDTDVNGGDVLTVTSVSDPARGSVVDNGDGTVTYTPDANLNGADSFTYSISDGNGGSDSATVSLTVTAVNDDPVASDDTVVVQVDTPLTISVRDNDSDVDGDLLTITAVGAAANGAVVNNGTTVTYTPNSGYTGADSFTYTIDDGNGGSDTATVSISVISIAYSGAVAPDNPGAQISPDITGGSNFTMINPDGSDIGGTNDLRVDWDGSIYTNAATQTTANMQIATATPTPFFGFVWVAKTVRVFGPGTYSFDTCPGAPNTLTNSGGVLGYIAPDGSTNCDPSGNDSVSMTIGPDQIGAHMLFDWNKSKNIDVVMVWDINAPWAGAPDGSNNFGAKGAVFNLSVVDADGDGTPGAPMVDGPFNGFNANFNLNLNPQFALPVVNASASQGGTTTSIVVPASGNVTVTAATGSGTFTYDWSDSDASLVAANVGGTSNSTLVFDPSGLADGVVTAKVTITDTSSNLQYTDILKLRIDSTQVLGNAVDADGDGVPNDRDGVADPKKISGNANDSSTYLLETSAGQIVLGDMAQDKGVETGLYGGVVESADIGVTDDAVDGSCVGGCFDFEIIGLSQGDTAMVVLPLSQAIPANALYRKFVNGAWRAFRATGTAPGALPGGIVSSAPGGPGTCPAPGSSSYTSGLTEGDFCVQLTLTDGGLNDADGTANGRIKDPGGIGGAAAEEVLVSNVPNPSLGGGGCTVNSRPIDPSNRSEWLLLAGLLGWLGWSRRKTRLH